ncbi:hypothetical protein HanRHA438_Chr11g0513211 [Helianthus annuus]|nr:hypothetical protein HanRHA438_Chr11g0513211 [Helianthus annuus]
MSEKKCLLAIIFSTCWFIWKARNDLTFNNLKRRTEYVRDEIISNLFRWVVNRSKHSNLCWEEWVKYPFVLFLVLYVVLWVLFFLFCNSCSFLASC